LRLCYFVAPSLTRGLVCTLFVQLLLFLARPVTLRSKFHRANGHILLSHLRLPQPGMAGSLIYNPQEHGGPVTHQVTGFYFVAAYDSQGLRWSYSNQPPHGSFKIKFLINLI
jgi:hypothetical protein